MRAGSAAGFMPRAMAGGGTHVELQPPQDDWHEQVWAVTHADLHRSAKVRAFVEVMKRTAT